MHEKLISFGVIADLQYCNAPPFKDRYYQNSTEKLKKAMAHLNEHALDFVINLGDLIDRDWDSYEKILPEFNHLNAPVYHVLGNHDYDVDDEKKDSVPSKIGTKHYYSFQLAGWRFIILDGNEISTFANLSDSPNYHLAEMWLQQMESSGAVNGNFYNGGIGNEQMNWLQGALDASREKSEQVIIFCHYPLFPPNKHNLLNGDQLLSILKNSKCVKLWMNGHNHEGNFGLFEDIHFVNVKGMVEGEHDMAWSIVNVFENRFEIAGFGNETSARLVF
jgi:manganese-dependent ADP-ribose/CDP-alcohol diphosphatase